MLASRRASVRSGLLPHALASAAAMHASSSNRQRVIPPGFPSLCAETVGIIFVLFVNWAVTKSTAVVIFVSDRFMNFRAKCCPPVHSGGGGLQFQGLTK